LHAKNQHHRSSLKGVDEREREKTMDLVATIFAWQPVFNTTWAAQALRSYQNIQIQVVVEQRREETTPKI
jgi:hypothetical protein